MIHTDFVWLTSYPRSGNTYLRTLLRHAFGLYSASIYPNDLGKNKALEEYVGHLEHAPDLMNRLRQAGIPLIKTHEHASDNRPAIYIIRDGRAACVSLWEFYNRTIPIETLIEGKHRFGLWADHVKSWNPWERPNTLLLKYEQLTDDLVGSLNTISEFLQIEIKSMDIPDRNTIAGADGKWVRKKTDWKSRLQKKALERFLELNRDILEKAGYL